MLDTLWRLAVVMGMGLAAEWLVARLLHGIALSFTKSWKFGRFWGTLLTFILLLVTGLLCLWRGIATLLV